MNKYKTVKEDGYYYIEKKCMFGDTDLVTEADVSNRASLCTHNIRFKEKYACDLLVDELNNSELANKREISDRHFMMMVCWSFLTLIMAGIFL